MESNVFALRARDGKVLWRRLFHAGTPGPNGLAVDGGTVVGSTDERVFALDADDGRLLWSRRILRPVDSFVDVAPLVVGGVVYTATTGYGPGTRPAIFALDERTGAVRWRFDDDSRRLGAPEARGRRRDLADTIAGRRDALRRHGEPLAVGRLAAAAERRERSPARRCTRTRCSRSTPAAGACAGSTR